MEIQYEVFRKNTTSKLQWYSGVITALVLESDETVQVTVRFRSSDAFPECEESFLFHKDKTLTREGRAFPFRLLTGEGAFRDTTVPSSTSSPYVDTNSISSRLLALEERLGRMEREGKQEMSPLYLTLCGLLNASFQKYTSTKHKFATGSDDICPYKLITSIDCSYSDFHPLFTHIKTLTDDLTISGPGEGSAIPSKMTISFRSFQGFCIAFSIPDNHFKYLLSTSHKSRKGEVISFKAVGTVAVDKNKSSLPTILCIGGPAETWADENYFFYRENSETVNSGKYACNYQRLQTRNSHFCQQSKLSHITTPSITLTWCSNDSNMYCRPTIRESAFVGTVSVQVPCIQFNDAKVASTISKWLGSNSNESDTNDSSSSGR